MKKWFLCICVVFLLLGTLTGCQSKPWQFEEPMEEIVSIEIVSAEDSLNYTVLKTLSEEEREEFLVLFQELLFNKVLGDPVSLYGTAVKITYESGLYEMISEHSAEYVKNGRIFYRLRYCDDGQAFNELIKSFLEADG